MASWLRALAAAGHASDRGSCASAPASAFHSQSSRRHPAHQMAGLALPFQIRASHRPADIGQPASQAFEERILNPEVLRSTSFPHSQRSVTTRSVTAFAFNLPVLCFLSPRQRIPPLHSSTRNSAQNHNGQFFPLRLSPILALRQGSRVQGIRQWGSGRATGAAQLALESQARLRYIPVNKAVLYSGKPGMGIRLCHT